MAYMTLERISFISVICAACLVSASAVHDWYALGNGPRTVPSSRVQGEHLQLSGVNWKDHKATVVLALNTWCHFCGASAPFYRQLADLRNRRHDLGLVAVFPQAESAAIHYLTAKGVAVDRVICEPLDRIMVEGTPTMYVVGPDGRVKDVWIGFLGEDKQRAAVASLMSLVDG